MIAETGKALDLKFIAQAAYFHFEIYYLMHIIIM